MAGRGEGQRGGKGHGSKSSKNPGAASRKGKRTRSHHRLIKKKARNVLLSSKGKWTWEKLSERNRLLNLGGGRKRPPPSSKEVTSLVTSKE